MIWPLGFQPSSYHPDNPTPKDVRPQPNQPVTIRGRPAKRALRPTRKDNPNVGASAARQYEPATYPVAKQFLQNVSPLFHSAKALLLHYKISHQTTRPSGALRHAHKPCLAIMIFL